MAKDDDEKVTISKAELDELRSKGMSKEEKHLREIIRDELKTVLSDVFQFGEGGDEGGGEGEGLGAGIRGFLGLKAAGE